MSRPLRVTFNVYNGAEFVLQCRTEGQEAVIMAALEAPVPDVCMTCAEHDHGQCDDCDVNHWRVQAWESVQARLIEGFREVGMYYKTHADAVAAIPPNPYPG